MLKIFKLLVLSIKSCAEHTTLSLGYEMVMIFLRIIICFCGGKLKPDRIRSVGIMNLSSVRIKNLDHHQ